MPQNPPEGMPQACPYVFYKDVSAALEWLQRVFGMSQRIAIGPEGQIMHAEVGLEAGVIMLGPASNEQGTASAADLPAVNQSIYFYVPDVDAHFDKAKEQGAEIVSEPEDMFWGDRLYAVRDIEGHHWTFAQQTRELAPEDIKPPWE